MYSLEEQGIRLAIFQEIMRHPAAAANPLPDVLSALDKVAACIIGNPVKKTAKRK